MNIQELIKKYEEKYETVFGFPVIQLNQILEDLKQLDEPQKVTIPQSVGDYIERAKESDWDLQDLFEFVGDQECGEIQKWFYDECNQETLALAWINGYTVAKEKRYLVKMKGINTNFNFLNRHRNENYWTFSNKDENTLYQTHHTRKELEEAGFGWVFDCEGIEIEEVEG